MKGTYTTIQYFYIFILFTMSSIKINSVRPTNYSAVGGLEMGTLILSKNILTCCLSLRIS